MYNIKEQGVKENFITVIEEVLVTQSSLTLFDPMDCSLPGSSVDGIFQARMLEWVAFPSPGDLPHPGIKPRSPTLQADALPSEPPGKPIESQKPHRELDGKTENPKTVFITKLGNISLQIIAGE